MAQNNDLFYGFNIVRQNIDGTVHATGIARARLASNCDQHSTGWEAHTDITATCGTAFQFKPRRIPAYRLPSGTAADTEASLHPLPPIQLAYLQMAALLTAATL